jgi:tetratricopeptide (TPR) repeat protein
MAYTHSTRRLTSNLALGILAVAGLATASPALAQQPGGRFRVLVPTLEVEGGAKEGFAKQVAQETRKLIDGMATHASVEKGELGKMLKQYNLKEKDLTCITSRQLAAQTSTELVMCGTVKPAGAENEVTALFVSAKDQQVFDVDAIKTADAKVAAQHIFSSFERYVNQLRLVAFCTEKLGQQDWEGALAQCEEALALNSKSQAGLYGKGYALMRLDRNEESYQALKAVLELNPVHQDALLSAGAVAAKLNLDAESGSYFNQYLELNPGNAQVRLKVAIDAAQAGNPEGALQILEVGLQGEEGDASLLEMAGTMAAAAAAKKAAQNGEGGLTPEARALYEKALGYLEKVYAAHGAETSVNALVQQLNALTQLGRTQEAVAFGEQAVAAKPQELALWRTYAMALHEAGRSAEAVAALDKVTAIDPNAAGVRALKGQWLVQEGKLEAAVAALREAVDGGDMESDNAALSIFGYGYGEKFQKQRQEEALPYFDAAARFATKATTKGMIHFFSGFALYGRAAKMQEPSTAASAKASLPVFQRVLEHFNQAGAYTETSPALAKSLQDFKNNTQQYIARQEAIIKAGR